MKSSNYPPGYKAYMDEMEMEDARNSYEQYKEAFENIQEIEDLLLDYSNNIELSSFIRDRRDANKLESEYLKIVKTGEQLVKAIFKLDRMVDIALESQNRR